MNLRRLGSTDIFLSPLGLGTVKLGRDQGVKYPTGFTIPDDQQALKLINRARELGINLIDTAPAYGESESRLGPLLKGQRQDWVICSKVGEEFHQGQSSFNFSPEHTRFSVERSLQRLHTDCIDILLVHSNGDDQHIIQHVGILDLLADLKAEGKIRAFGMSTKTIEGGLLAAQTSDAVMVTYNLNERSERPVIDYCAAHNKGVLIKKALASGHICHTNDNAATVNSTPEHRDALAVDPIAASMEFVLSTPGVSSAIVGTINPKHLALNVEKALAVLTPA
ncbi:aldo/keto reductase [Simiduia curdlanivorans]|uniref:Aldo/keto reductase n=1 Tax=Simiduia curdlanivorans TaxID=1492769 RepID=A0ABV8V122_9GAMM|nr:aldo/keto reductase [Simiduia curdlanivorans]MDN3637763.1 aldo/keto reductase [Simiduia curdlanivorans]